MSFNSLSLFSKSSESNSWSFSPQRISPLHLYLICLPHFFYHCYTGSWEPCYRREPYLVWLLLSTCRVIVTLSISNQTNSCWVYAPISFKNGAPFQSSLSFFKFIIVKYTLGVNKFSLLCTYRKMKKEYREQWIVICNDNFFEKEHKIYAFPCLFYNAGMVIESLLYHIP